MAILAVLAQVSLVRLVFVMAAKAGSCSFRPFLALQVAAIAFNLLVGADERVIRSVVIKDFIVYLYDISLPAIMFLMTVTAGDIRHQFAFAVKTARSRPVRGDFLVTCKT